jgi:hypothetical protein
MFDGQKKVVDSSNPHVVDAEYPQGISELYQP